MGGHTLHSGGGLNEGPVIAFNHQNKEPDLQSCLLGAVGGTSGQPPSRSGGVCG